MSAFQLHNLTENVPDSLAGGVVAIGNFDGVHRGHQVVLGRALNEARKAGVPALALSFEPHPRTLFKPQSPVFRLTAEQDKAGIVEAFGMDGLLTLPFTKELAGTEAEAFVTDILRGRAAASHLVTGFNFHFGKGRAGSPEFLQEVGQRDGFGVTTVEAEEEGGDAISSSRIRRQLGAGDVAAAADLLGYRWRVGGTVVKGAQLGRTLGYPTANLALAENCRLAHGIYAVRLRRADGSLHDGVASFGRRPTFDNGAPLLETFVFDFSDDLYGERIEVSLFEHLRGEEKFDSAEALVEQMDRDSEAARKALAAATPLSNLDERLSFDRNV
ncbi:bifunctional riboflavin kinase/FAD synthetase [Ahrensia sp. R2A130]|uniref:bifunctional riboflavin kinase/FAD synthetase n=1 Tax=Ahrensia sp. R2A130 TaxID=744979 RepID=UPI0001E0946E|nr:bifunctional riboflavin kinase/FAD synthetase [Ahrensia sp. R2A130]EFL88555.1 riboflavin biosynthesis protein RibF [Ahrensia sp. R2A130]